MRKGFKGSVAAKVFQPAVSPGSMARRCPALLVALALFASSLVSSATNSVVQMLVPGFTVQELPVKLSNVNNLRFARDGRLTTLGYNGKIHLLRDTDGDGLEDEVKVFWDKPTITVPVGMCWAPEGLYVSSRGKVSLLRDNNDDGVADDEEVIASGWPKTDVASGGVDATAVTLDGDGNVYFGLLTADYSNPYRVDKEGKARYSTNDMRGTIQKWSPKTKKLETVATGVRVPYTLAFNKAGDLFLTDQEGETWCPDGNPLDELNHIVQGRNYGFPPRQPQYLPNLISEPPVIGFGPQHQSTCGFTFNEPGLRQEVFGPRSWEGDAIVAGESRGKLWRARLAKTSRGYIGAPYPIARLSMLTTDVAISPEGDLYVSCHSGEPDWGTGPNGEGKLFKISYTNPEAPQPVAVWAADPFEVHVTFDRPIDGSVLKHLAGSDIDVGHFVSAGDRFEVLKPPYNVVKQQDATPRGKLRVLGGTLMEGGRLLVVRTAPHPQSVTFALTLSNVKAAGAAGDGSTVDLEYRLNGVNALWFRADKQQGTGAWLPHIDPAVNRHWMKDSEYHQSFNHLTSDRGSFGLKTALNLPPGTNYLYFEANIPFSLWLGDVRHDGTNNGGPFYVATVASAIVDEPLPFVLNYETGLSADDFLRVSWSNDSDPTRRPLPFSAFLQDWAPHPRPPAPLLEENAELAGGDFERGKKLFFGDQLKCGDCHKIRGEGKTVAPDLSNLAHRDAASVLRDIKEPNATIHPDYVAFDATLQNDESVSGFVRAQTEGLLAIVQADGKELKVPRAEVKQLRPSTLSLMPEGLLDGLHDKQVRDLLVFLTSEPPTRKDEEVQAILRASESEQATAGTNATMVVWVAGKQDHGPGEHDYPACEAAWSSLLVQDRKLLMTNAWEWPTDEQFARADVIAFYFWNRNWSAERLSQIDRFLERGGGLVVLHSATIADKNPEQLAERIGLASSPSRTKYIHAPVDLKIVGTNDIVRGLPKTIRFLDEPYWPMIGATSNLVVLATVSQEGKDWPQVWTFEKGKGRVFASILGHYTWTHHDPMFRIMILRGLAWAAGQPVTSFQHLAAPTAK